MGDDRESLIPDPNWIAGNADAKSPCLENGQTVLIRKTPGGKDLSKMKAQYAMFVDAVGSKQVTP